MLTVQNSLDQHKKYEHKDKLNTELNQLVPVNNYNCPFCEVKFSDKDESYDHVSKHLDDNFGSIKTKPCYFYLKGKCNKQRQCKFSHTKLYSYGKQSLCPSKGGQGGITIHWIFIFWCQKLDIGSLILAPPWSSRSGIQMIIFDFNQHR